VAAVEQEVWEAASELVGPLRLPRAFCPAEPTAKQEWFLRRDELEVFFGGAAGPGKSFGLLMAALMYVDVPGYDALILRTVLQDHKKPKALIPTSHDWLGGTGATWNGSEYQWTFPSGATLSFGYIRTIADLSHFKGPAYAFVGFDELTEFDEQVYRGMSRVLRDPPEMAPGVYVPLRKRSASNPGGPGHSWVKSRFIDAASRAREAVFVPATIRDNPHMNYEEYLESLAHLDPVDRMRLINGDWDVMEEGGKFNRHKIVVIDRDAKPPAQKAVRYWDLAGTVPTPTNTDPDWTVGLRLEVDAAGTFTIVDIVRGRWDDSEVQEVVQATASQDGHGVPVYVEQDPGQAGKAQLNHYKRHVLSGYACHAGLTRIDGKSAAKEVRARPAAAAVGNGLVQIVRGANQIEALDELAIFPNGNHDDIVDAFSGAHNALTSSGTGRGGTSVPRARIPGVQSRGAGTDRR
jgi:predicted phage terminase large subunit-like protein